MTITNTLLRKEAPQSGHRPVRRGRWMYASHSGLNPGWRLFGTALVLDYDPYDRSGERQGCFHLWSEGRLIEPVGHYLPDAMEWVEHLPAGRLLDPLAAPVRTEDAALRAVVCALAAEISGRSVIDVVELAEAVVRGR